MRESAQPSRRKQRSGFALPAGSPVAPKSVGLRLELDRASPSRNPPLSSEVVHAYGADEIYRRLAVDIVNVIDVITFRTIEKVQAELAEQPSCAAAIAANILDFRRDLHRAAGRIIEQSRGERDERIRRVRLALRMDLKVAAAFLLDLVDGAGRAHRCAPGGAKPKGYCRRSAVYAAHIRRALRPHGLDETLMTVPSHGYQLSVPDAQRIRRLWGETS